MIKTVAMFNPSPQPPILVDLFCTGEAVQRDIGDQDDWLVEMGVLDHDHPEGLLGMLGQTDGKPAQLHLVQASSSGMFVEDLKSGRVQHALDQVLEDFPFPAIHLCLRPGAGKRSL